MFYNSKVYRSKFDCAMLSYIGHLILLINLMQYILITVQYQLWLSLAQLSPSLFPLFFPMVPRCRSAGIFKINIEFNGIKFGKNIFYSEM